MAATMQSLGIDKLSREERWQLVEEIIESLGETESKLLSSAQMEDLKLRAGSHRQNPDDVIPWDEAKKRLGWID